MDELTSLRQQIDQIDTDILQLLEKRIALMKSVGKAKKEIGIEIRDPQREEEKMAMLEKKAEELQIPLELLHTIWQEMFHLSDEIEK